MSKEESNEHQEIEEKLKIEPQQDHANKMLTVIPEEQYSPYSVSPSP